ncbi:MAG: ankyrin repeat domain-containing protein [Sulfurovaceae bacterium]|nr:ankyrin repeat domain-containing protein [Sulfurovaceae bacterium]MDD5548168.1 ankyrin repeat domain-containing protein [Sulfurovaceae bacterium]
MNNLSNAIDRDSIIELKKLIENGENLNQTLIIGEEYDLDSPDEVGVINYAIRKNASLELIVFLVEHGADIFEVDSEGISILDIAIKFKRYDVVQFCIDKGIDINITKRKSGILPIILASCFNDVEMIKLLIKNGVKIDGLDKSGMCAADYALKMGQKDVAKFLEELEKEKDE